MPPSGPPKLRQWTHQSGRPTGPDITRRRKQMALLTLSPYKAKEFPWPSGLHGISDHTLEIHFGLYAGYVKNTNLLTEQLVELAGKGQS